MKFKMPKLNGFMASLDKKGIFTRWINQTLEEKPFGARFFNTILMPILKEGGKFGVYTRDGVCETGFFNNCANIPLNWLSSERIRMLYGDKGIRIEVSSLIFFDKDNNMVTDSPQILICRCFCETADGKKVLVCMEYVLIKDSKFPVFMKDEGDLDMEIGPNDTLCEMRESTPVVFSLVEGISVRANKNVEDLIKDGYGTHSIKDMLVLLSVLVIDKESGEESINMPESYYVVYRKEKVIIKRPTEKDFYK